MGICVHVFIICFVNLVYLLSFNRVLGQYIPKQELRNKTTCDLKINLDITCGSDAVIVIQSFYFYYHPDCETICCDFDNTHYKIGADSNDITAVRRLCSGRTDCSLEPLEGIRDFGVEANIQEPSYVYIYHYCIPESRLTSCPVNNLVSAGEPIYLTSNNYPLVATGDSSCTCSVEVFSCTSRVNSYIIDADMYLDEDNCEQNIDFLDGRNTSLDKIDCRSYSVNEIVTKSFATNYIKIDFKDYSSQNQEGFFLLGFGVTEETAFKLSCSFEEQTVCMDCGEPVIQYGSAILKEVSISTFGSAAEIKCQDGYETKKSTIKCKETGLWENSTCEYISDNGNGSTIWIPILVSSSLIAIIVIVGLFFKKRQNRGNVSKDRQNTNNIRNDCVNFKPSDALEDEEKNIIQISDLTTKQKILMMNLCSRRCPRHEKLTT